MLEMAEGTIWGSTTVLKIANCVCSVHKVVEGQYSMERYNHRSAYLEQGRVVNANFKRSQPGLSQQNSRVVCRGYSLL